MSADLQFKQLIDRILRCREAEDAAKEDTKEVYAELKGMGFDKTAAGALVAEMRKREKNPDQFAERETVLDLYRDAYQRASGTPLATHTHDKTKSPSHAAVVTDDHLREPVAAAPGRIIREGGDAPREASDGGSLPDTEFEPPAFLAKDRKPLRPLCLNPSECAGYGTHTCHRCLKAAGQAEVAA